MTTDPTAIDLTTDPFLARFTGRTYHGGIGFDVPYMTEVADNLWQGGCRDGLVLPHAISHVVSLYPWEAYTVEHSLESYLMVRMFDSASQSVDQVENLAAWVNLCRRTGPVLVHCQAGLNRSALVVGRALTLGGMTAGDAIQLLRAKRSPAVLCNEAFEAYIREVAA